MIASISCQHEHPRDPPLCELQSRPRRLYRVASRNARLATTRRKVVTALVIAAIGDCDGWPIFGDPVRGRSCGSCHACCTQVPVVLDEATKPANVRCGFQGSRGCRIYANRPTPCRAWSCKWLFDPDASALKRPDIGGYIIDPMLDTVLMNDEPVEIIQVWVDPHRRDAHRAPELRDWLELMAQRHRLIAIVRWSSDDGMVLIPPAITGDVWIEHAGTMVTEGAMRAKLDHVRGETKARLLGAARQLGVAA
jgi:hypothetical protein